MFLIIASVYYAHTISRHHAKIFHTLSHLILHPLYEGRTIIITEGKLRHREVGLIAQCQTPGN